MKKQAYSIFLLFLSALVIFSCEDKDATSEDEIVEDTVMEEVPNLSDTHFEEALVAFKNAKMQDAAMHIRKGAAELQKEAIKNKEASSINQTALENTAKELNQLASDIEADKVRDTDRLRETFANAALTVAHDYLVFTDVYVLEKPEKVISSKLNKTYDKAAQAFENMKKDLSEAAKKEADKMSAETQALQNKRNALDAEVSAHLKKMRDFVKKHQPAKEKDFPYDEL